MPRQPNAVIVASHPSENGVALFDRESAAHFGVGLLAGSLGWSRSLVVLGILGLSALRIAVTDGARTALFKRSPGTALGNEALDVILTMIGHYAGERVRAQRGAMT